MPLSVGLLDLITHELDKAGQCKKHRRHERQLGIFECTFGCGRKFQRVWEWERHEQAVQPDKFWFCWSCGDVNNPSLECLYMRKDKFVSHIKSQHDEDVAEVLVQSKVAYTPPFRERCGFCDRNKFKAKNPKHRFCHIAKQHFEKGFTMASWRHWREDYEAEDSEDDADFAEGETDDDDDDNADNGDDNDQDSDPGHDTGHGNTTFDNNDNAFPPSSNLFPTESSNPYFGSFLQDSYGWSLQSCDISAMVTGIGSTISDRKPPYRILQFHIGTEMNLQKTTASVYELLRKVAHSLYILRSFYLLQLPANSPQKVA